MIYFRRPTVNLTALEGRWLIRLSGRARMIGRNLVPGDVVPLENSGLELRLEKVRLPVTVVMDRNKAPRL